MTQLNAGDKIPSELLDMEFDGLQHPPKAFSELIGDSPTLLVFLRHFG